MGVGLAKVTTIKVNNRIRKHKQNSETDFDSRKSHDPAPTQPTPQDPGPPGETGRGKEPKSRLLASAKFLNKR